MDGHNIHSVYGTNSTFFLMIFQAFFSGILYNIFYGIVQLLRFVSLHLHLPGPAEQIWTLGLLSRI